MTAMTLLQLALTLLIAVQSNPHVTPELRAQAVSVAYAAINAAQAEQAKTAAPSVQKAAVGIPVPLEAATPSCKAWNEVKTKQGYGETVTVSWESFNTTTGSLDRFTLTPVAKGSLEGLSYDSYVGKNVELSFSGKGGNARCFTKVEPVR